MHSSRMKPVQQWKSAREDRALRDVGECLRQLGQEEGRLHELHTYLGEYETRLVQSETMPAALQNRHAFLVRLREAIRYEEQRVHEVRGAYEQQCSRWQQTTRDRKTVEKVTSALKAREEKHQERRRQNELDEFAQRRFVAVPC